MKKDKNKPKQITIHEVLTERTRSSLIPMTIKFLNIMGVREMQGRDRLIQFK